MDVQRLAEQLREIERRFAPPGGADDAARVKQLAEWRSREPDREETLSTANATGGWVTLFLCSRYGLSPFRRPRQRPTTMCIRAPKTFVSEVFWPQVQAMVRVFEVAKEQAVTALAAEWLGAERADVPLHLEEEK